MSTIESSYKQIFKATSIFGGVQFVNIIVQVIRSKAIALLIGPAGMGVFGLITSTIALIAGITNFGLGTSAVKELSAAVASGDEKKVSLTISIFRKLVWITGLLGVILTVVLSPFLSKLTFSNYEYTLSFVFVSITLLFMQLTAGQNVLLQGLRKLNLLAKANVFAAIFSLVLTLPLYFFYGVKGVVPAIVIASIISFITEFFFASKVKVEQLKVSFSTAIKDGKEMLTLGFMLSLSSLVSLGASYIIRIYITKTGSIDDVGLYSAGFAIINNYVGLFFTAMATDYYPKLAGVTTSKGDVNGLVNQQSEIAILILAPLLCIFLVFIKVLVVVLYSDKFLPVEGMLHWAILGIFFKTVGWALGFVLLTKGSGKLYFFSELAANTYMLILNVVGYKLFGLDGLGISFVLGFFIYFLQVFILCHKKFSFEYFGGFYKIFLVHLLLAIGCFICAKLFTGIIFYLSGIIIIILSITFSLSQINKLINLRSVFSKIKNRGK